MPLLLGRLEEQKANRWWTLVSITLASLGVFACGARLPVILFGFVVAGSLFHLRKRPFVLAIAIFGMAIVGYSVSRSDRLRRFETLGDPEMVGERIAGSVNMSFLDIVSDYPVGKGLGSAAGTSVHRFFLAEYARPPIGIESEYGRIMSIGREGLPGLFLWLGFVGWALGRMCSWTRKVGD